MVKVLIVFISLCFSVLGFSQKENRLGNPEGGWVLNSVVIQQTTEDGVVHELYYDTLSYINPVDCIYPKITIRNDSCLFEYKSIQSIPYECDMKETGRLICWFTGSLAPVEYDYSMISVNRLLLTRTYNRIYEKDRSRANFSINLIYCREDEK